MKYRIAFALAMVGLFAECAAKVPLPVSVQIPTRHIDYFRVKPLRLGDLERILPGSRS